MKRLYGLCAAIGIVVLLWGCNSSPDSTERDVAPTLTGPLFSCTGVSETLYPNEDLTPLDWYVWPGLSPDHYALIDEGSSLDGSFVHSNVYDLEDTWGFTNVNNPHPNGVVYKLIYHVWVTIDLRGAGPEQMELSYLIDDTVQDTEMVTEYQDSLTTEWVVTFDTYFALTDINSLATQVRDLTSTAAVHIESIWVVARWFVPGKGCPIPEE